MRLSAWLLTILGLIASTGPGAAFASPATAAFDCATAEGTVEEMICADDELAALDRTMNTVYGASVAAIDALDESTTALSELRSEQRGWVMGRNDCWKAADQRACVVDTYAQRIASLQATWGLVPHGDPVSYVCNHNPADEIVATFYQAERPAVRLERGDSTAVAVLQPSASGSRYESDFGIGFWIKGEDAQVDWPEGNSFTCRVR